MLYQITFHTDHQALGFGEQRSQVSAAELERASQARQDGRLLGFWLRADLSGVVFILDAASNEELMQELQTLPLFPYLRAIDVVPLVAHPQFPEFDTEHRADTQARIS